MFCPVCGKELEVNARFCPECGAKIIGGTPIPYEKANRITEVTPTSKLSESTRTKHSSYTRSHPHPVRHRRGLTVGLFIGMLLLAGGGIFGIVMAVNWGSIEGYNYYYYDNPVPASIESLSFDIEVSNVAIRYNDSETDHLIQIEYHYHVSGGFVDEKTFDDIYEVTWDNSSPTVSFTSEFLWFTNWVFNDRSIVTITLRSDVIWAINGDVTTGALNFIIPENSVLDNFSLAATTGDISLTIFNGTKFQQDFDVTVTTGSITVSGDGVEFQKAFSLLATTGDIEVTGTLFEFKGNFLADISTGSISMVFVDPEFADTVNLYATTGDIDIELSNPTYSSNTSNWAADISTGSIYLIINQPNPMNTNVTANFHATTGDIDIEMTLDSSIGAQFISSVTTGDIDYDNLGGFEVLGDMFRTTSYPKSSNYIFTLGVSTGSINVKGLISS